jgi:hypothetical protein
MWTLLLSLAQAAEPGFVRTELHFGGTVPDPSCLLVDDIDPATCPRKQLTEADFHTFAETTAAPLLPGGFVVMPVEQWLAPSRGAEPAPSRAWVMVVTWRDPAVSSKIDELRSSYMTLFQQSGVPRIDAAVSLTR